MKLEKKLDIKLDNVIINNININDYVPVDEYNSKVEELNITKEDLIKTETELSKSQLELDSTKEILIEKESELVEAKEEVEELTEQLSNYKVDVAANNLRFGYSSFETIPSMFDFSNVTDYSYMFYRSNLKNFNATWDT